MLSSNGDACEGAGAAAPMELTAAAIALLNDPEKEQAAVVERVLRPYLMHLDQIVERLTDINDHIEDTEVPLLPPILLGIPLLHAL